MEYPRQAPPGAPPGLGAGGLQGPAPAKPWDPRETIGEIGQKWDDFDLKALIQGIIQKITSREDVMNIGQSEQLHKLDKYPGPATGPQSNRLNPQQRQQMLASLSSNLGGGRLG